MYIKANAKQYDIKELLALYTFINFNKYLQNLKYNVKRARIFHLILLGIPSSLILSVKSSGSAFYYLTKSTEHDKSNLSMFP